MQNFSDAVLGTHTNQGVINGVTQGLPFLMRHPIQSGEMLLNSAGQAQQGTQQRAAEQLQQPGLSNKVQGVTRGAYGMLPFLGPMLEKGGQQFQQGDVAGGLGTTGAASLPFLAKPIGERGAAAIDTTKNAVSGFVNAESNPHDLAQSYVKAVGNKPAPVPSLSEPLKDALVSDISNEIENQPIAERLQSGNTTIADLDFIRQRSNYMARSIYNAIQRGDQTYPASRADAAKNFADRIRQQIYPQIESANNLPEGTMQQIRALQGDTMDKPGLVSRIGRHVVGGGIGAAAGEYFGGPVGRNIGFAAGVAGAEPIIRATRGAITAAKTRNLASGLPAPYAQLPFLPKGLLPSAPIELGSRMEPIEPASPPPIFDAGTRAQRLGLLLPEQTSIPLGSSMDTPGELQSAASRVVRDPRTGKMRRMYVTSGRKDGTAQ